MVALGHHAGPSVLRLAGRKFAQKLFDSFFFENRQQNPMNHDVGVAADRTRELRVLVEAQREMLRIFIVADKILGLPHARDDGEETDCVRDNIRSFAFAGADVVQRFLDGQGGRVVVPAGQGIELIKCSLKRCGESVGL